MMSANCQSVTVYVPDIFLRGDHGCLQRRDGFCGERQPLCVFRAGMPSHLKAVLDRTIPLVKMKMVQEADGTVRHEALADFSKLHTLVLCGCGFPDWEGNFDGLRMQCRQCFRDPQMVCVPEAPMLSVPQAAVVADPLLARFEEAGAEYARSLTLSPETIARLETPMIPKEDYIRIVNGA